MELHEGKKPDQALSGRIVDLVQPNDLVLRDLGYFCLAVFFQIAAKQAFFLSRLIPNIKVYPQGEKSEEPLDLSAYLQQKKYRDCSVIEFQALLGKEDRLPVRVIAYRLPQRLVNERRRKARAVAKKKNYTPSPKRLNLLAFSLYITNVDSSVWSAEVIGTLYRLRWQIELTFKRWKSLLRIDFCKGSNPHRISTLIYARLIAIVLLHDFYALAASYADAFLHRELSPYPLYQWLTRHHRLSLALRLHQLSDLWRRFTLIALSLCKQKRTRRTTWELLELHIPFSDSSPLKPRISNA